MLRYACDKVFLSHFPIVQPVVNTTICIFLLKFNVTQQASAALNIDVLHDT